MSLTSIISDDDHPLTRWLRSRLRRTAALRASYSLDLPHRRVQRPVAPGRSMVRWDLLGTAIDFRIRCAFTSQVPSSAALGVLEAGHIGGEHLSRLGRSLLDEFTAHVGREQPYRRGHPWVADPNAEHHLDRLCFTLAWFDRIFRDNRIGPGSPLAAAPPMDLAELLASVPEHAVLDLRTQALLAERALGNLRDSTSAAQCHGAPTFAGSADVGGADADLLVAGRLLEIKAVSHPTALADTAILQLAGYLLLDYDDAHRIQEVGLYMTRIGWLKMWPAAEFLRLLGARAPLPRLRADFAAAAATFTPHPT